VREVAALMLPISLGMAATQVNLVVDRVLATILPAGRVAALGYANYVVQVPLGTFAAALAMVIFPFLAHDAALDRLDDLKRRAILALRLNLFVQVPAAAGLAILSVPVIQFIYQRGAFNVASTGYTSGALVFFCLGLFPQAGVALLARVFYALRDVRTPVRAALATIVVNVGLNLVLVHPLQQEGLALGTSTAALFNLALLLRQASRRFGGFGGGVLTRTALRSLVASAVMALGAYNVYTLLSAPLECSLHRAIALFAAVAAGAALYALVSALLRAEELGMVLGMLRRRGAPQGA
jgi:putative peptidoglycan lipid II flippase